MKSKAPTYSRSGSGAHEAAPGISQRDWTAVKLACALLANAELSRQPRGQQFFDDIAAVSYGLADALIGESNRQGEAQ